MRYGVHYDDDADEDGLSLQKAHTIYILFLVADLRRYIERKAYDPNEPRDDHGRWTTGGGSSGSLQSKPARVRLADAGDDWTLGLGIGSDGETSSKAPTYYDDSNYSPDLRGWHNYYAGPNVVCTAAQKCTRDQMADYLSRFAVPGQSPDNPVVSHGAYTVYDPTTGMIAGRITTEISNDGLTVKNTTGWDHILYDGVAIRTATQNSDGSWSITTHGYGNNWVPLMDIENQRYGPSIFDKVDSQMRDYIARNHGSQKSAARLIHIARSGRGTYPGMPLRTRPSTGGHRHGLV